MQIYQDQNRSLKLDFHANRTSRRYITLPMFLLSMRLPLPGILISSSRSSDGEKRRCMRWANGNVAMVFPLGAFHSVFLFLSFHNCRSFVHPLDSCFRSRSRADPVYFLFRSKFRSNLTYFNFSLFRAFLLFKKGKRSMRHSFVIGCSASDPKFRVGGRGRGRSGHSLVSKMFIINQLKASSRKSHSTK